MVVVVWSQGRGGGERSGPKGGKQEKSDETEGLELQAQKESKVRHETSPSGCVLLGKAVRGCFRATAFELGLVDWLAG